MLEESWKSPQCLLNKVKITTMSTFKFKALLQHHYITASRMIWCPCLLYDMLKYPKFFNHMQLCFCGIYCQYFDCKESTFSGFPKQSVIFRCSKWRNILNIKSKPNIGMLTPFKLTNDLVSRIENGSEGCIVESRGSSGQCTPTGGLTLVERKWNKWEKGLQKGILGK